MFFVLLMFLVLILINYSNSVEIKINFNLASSFSSTMSACFKRRNLSSTELNKFIIFFVDDAFYISYTSYINVTKHV